MFIKNCQGCANIKDSAEPSWQIDHIKHKALTDVLDVMVAYTYYNTEWEDITDHRSLWAMFRTQAFFIRAPLCKSPEHTHFDLNMRHRLMASVNGRNFSACIARFSCKRHIGCYNTTRLHIPHTTIFCKDTRKPRNNEAPSRIPGARKTWYTRHT